jgi:hypothetical protein
MPGLEEFLFSAVLKLLSGVIQEGVKYKALPFFQRRRIERRVEDVTAEVVEPLLPFLSQEGIPEDKQRRLIQTCVDELRPLTEEPALLFQGSLDGQKVFENLYADRDLPEVVVEDGLSEVYALLCPRIATLVCTIPALVKDWESEAWSENYRRFDELTSQMSKLFGKVDELARSPSEDADAMLTMLRRTLAQRIGLELDLTGLRADRPLAGKFDDYFVHPQLREGFEREKEEGEARLIDESIEALSQFAVSGSRAILIGAPGSGKSTWTKWLQREVLSAHWSGLGVRVELRRFSSEPLPSLYELIREAAGKHLAEEVTANRIGKWLKAGQVVFMLDGFDEIQPGERETVYRWIVDLRVAARDCPFVLTSRPLTTDHLDRLGEDWQCWTIQPFDEDRIVDYIERWYAHTPLLLEADRDIDAAHLAASWRADPTIGPLTGNPLLLSTLLMVHHLDGSLPAGRSQLYRRYVDGMLGLWDDRRKVVATGIPLSLQQKRQIIRGLAVHMFLMAVDQLEEPAILGLVQQLLEQVDTSLAGDDVLAVLRERSGLIVGPGIYSFAHKSVAEYLVAEAVLQGDQSDPVGRRIDRFYLFEHRDDDRWNAVTFLWAGLAPIADVESFVEACMDSGSWALACGVLADQYDRLPLKNRRRLLLGVVSSGCSAFPSYRGMYRWVTSEPRSDKAVVLEIPSFPLRGLVSDARFHSLVSRALSDGTLEWSDGLSSGEEMRDLFWMTCVAWPTTVDELKALLATKCPAGASSAAWLFWALERMSIDAFLSQKPVDLEDALGAFRERRPEARGLVPIALMCAALSLARSPDFPPEAAGGITRLLELLPDSDGGQAASDWLPRTRDWVLGRGASYEESIGDLLSVFVQEMERLAEKGMLKRDPTFQRAMRYVEGMRQRREAR